MIERTLVLIKPDGVARSLVGRVIQRFEDAGLKIVGMRMEYVTKDFAKKHYTEDITIRRGERVRTLLVDFISSGPIVALALEGISAISVVRKIVGSTQPSEALPGTIRGDFQHQTYAYSDAKNIPIKNVIHASSDAKDAEYELNLWFSKAQLHSYKSVHDAHILE